MTISDINASFSNTPASTTSSDMNIASTVSITEQAVNGIKNIGSSFSTFFDDATPATSDVVVQTATELATEETGIASMQQNLLASLGLVANSTDNSALESLTSQASIEAMQGTILTALQTSLFTQKQSSTATQGGEVTSTVATAESGFTLASLEQLSFGEDGINMKDGFDIVNSLNHIPILSGIYEDATEQSVSPISKLAGGFLYGGTVGLAFSTLELAFEHYSGSSISDTVTSFDYAGLFSTDEQADTQDATNTTGENKIGPEYFSLAGQMAADRLK